MFDWDDDGDVDSSDWLFTWILLDSEGRFSWPSFIATLIIIGILLMVYYYWS